MQISLINKKNVHTETLPKEISGDYWIYDENDIRLINIQANNENWELISNNNAGIVDLKHIMLDEKGNFVLLKDAKKIDSAILKENAIYAVYNSKAGEVIFIYCSSEYKKFFHMDIVGTEEINIGRDKNNHIVYEHYLISSMHARIVKKQGKWIIYNFNKYGTYVNNLNINGTPKVLNNGDVIFLMGLKIIIMGNSIYINNMNLDILNLNNKFLTISSIKSPKPLDEENGDDNIEITKTKNYYSRAPRISKTIKREEINFEQPPSSKDTDKKPMALVLGSSISMGVMTLASTALTINGIITGQASIGETIITIITSITMLIGMLVIPFLDITYDKKTKERYEKKRQKKYREYLSRKNEEISKIKLNQRKILFENYPSAIDCSKIIMANNPRLWERKIEDEDFLSVRLGLGDVPVSLDITYPTDELQMEEDELFNIMQNIALNSKTIKDSPVILSLLNNPVSAIIGKDKEQISGLMKNIILQLVTFHSYEDLKLVFLVNSQSEWDYVKMLPHIFNNTKQVRFFASDYDDMNEISKYLSEELKNRKTSENSNETNVYKNYNPYYLIITDDYKQAETLNFISEFRKIKNNIGFSLLCITDDLFQLPNECKTFISLSEGKAIIFDNELSENEQTEIKLDPLIKQFPENVIKKLANIPIRMKLSGTTSLPQSFNFLEMFGVGNIERLKISERWKRNDATLSLKTPIGIDGNEKIISLDAHEKAHGPHGLIAGSTGSGKSEFIITYVLSLAVNYHPDDVSFLLIDYKGGGLAGAFKKNDIKLPHLVGTITNIDKNGLNRSLTSIQSELRRRQVIFNEARNLTEEGTIDIYKYQRLYHNGVVKEPIAHLFIICDEFAELKQQQEDFMDELMSVSRIGRSLGVHLILATQKPAGIVNDQIRSNSKFAISLKVQDTSDSIDVIKKPDAAYLKKAGQFYLQVGNDEYFVLGQSGWAGASYFPADVAKKKIDTSIEFISNIGTSIKTIDSTVQQATESQGEQLTSILRYICNLADKENIKKENLWLDDVPENIYVKDLRKKYNVPLNKNEVLGVVGEYDDPSNQKQGLVSFDIMKREHIAVYGNAESGKETFLSTLIYDLMTTYSPEQIQMYIIDLGSEALKIYAKSPHVGDLVFAGEDEKLDRLIKMIQEEIKTRKNLLSDYNGDYELYIEKGNTMPLIAIVINNYDTFNENYEEKYDDLLLTLTRECAKCGMIFITSLSSTQSMRYRLGQNFTKKIALQLNTDDEYINIFESTPKIRPSHIFGRGIIDIEDGNVFEFQTARVCSHINYNEHIEETINELNKKYEIKAPKIPVIPEVIRIQDVENEISSIDTVPIGMFNHNLAICKYNFKENFINLISSKKIKEVTEYISYLQEVIRKTNDAELNVFDYTKSSTGKGDLKKEFKKYTTDTIKKTKDKKYIICMIIGIDNLIKDEIADEEMLNEFVEKLIESQNASLVIVDTLDGIKDHEYESWFESHAKTKSGIWVGDGIRDQMLFDLDLDYDPDEKQYGSSYGYRVIDDDAKLIKLIGVKGEEDDGK